MIWLVSLVLFVPSMVQATTYYVSATTLNGYGLGSDSRTCIQAQNKSTPKLTIDKTASSGLGCLSSGDTLVINEGTYDNDEISNPPGGTLGAYTVIQGEPSGNRPLLRPTMDSTKTRRGFLCTGGSSCSFIRLEYIEVYRAYNSVNLVSGGTTYPTNVEFINNKFCHTIHTNFNGYFSKTGFLGGPFIIRGNEFCNTGEFYTDISGNTNPYVPRHNTIYGVGNDSLIEYNVFHDLANGIGVWTDPSQQRNMTARYNVFYNIGREDLNSWLRDTSGVTGTYSAIHISVPGGGHKIYGNLVYNFCDTVANVAHRCVGIANGWTGYGSGLADIYNNTLYNALDSNTDCLAMRDPGGSAQFPNMNIKNNICYQAGIIYQCPGCTGSVSNNLTSNPSFVNAGSGNFALAAGSAAINGGVNVGYLPFNGAAPDQGAFETFTCTSGTVAGNTLDLQCDMALNTPMTVGALAGYTVNNSRSVTNAALVGASTVRLTFDGSACTNLETWQVTYNESPGTATDGTLIGGTANQPLWDFGPLTVTNNCGGGGPAYTLTQSAGAIYGALGSQATVDLLTTGVSPGGIVSIRTKKNATGGAPPSITTKLQCTTGSEGGTYADVPDSANAGNCPNLEFVGLSAIVGMPSHATPVTVERLTSDFSGMVQGAVIRCGTGCEAPAMALTQDSEGEMVWLVHVTSAATRGTTYYFREVLSDGTALTYAVNSRPSLMVVGPQASFGF